MMIRLKQESNFKIRMVVLIGILEVFSCCLEDLSFLKTSLSLMSIVSTIKLGEERFKLNIVDKTTLPNQDGSTCLETQVVLKT